MRKLYMRAVHLLVSRVGRILLDCTRCSLVLVLSLFSAYNFVKLLFSFVIPAEVLKVWISRHMLASSWLRLRFLEKVRLKRVSQGVPVPLFPSIFCPMFTCSCSFSLFAPCNILVYHILPTLNSSTPSKNKDDPEETAF